MSIPTTCEWLRYRDVAHGPFRVCGESMVFDGPEGKRTLVMWSSSRGRYVGPCCWKRAGETVLEQAIAMYGEDWESTYRPHVDTAESLAVEESRRRFAWTLTDVSLPRFGTGRGSLKRMDNSDAIDEWQPQVRRVE